MGCHHSKVRYVDRPSSAPYSPEERLPWDGHRASSRSFQSDARLSSINVETVDFPEPEPQRRVVRIREVEPEPKEVVVKKEMVLKEEKKVEEHEETLEELSEVIFSKIQHGDMKSVQRFLMLEGDVNFEDKEKNTLLNIAARYGQKDIAKFLIHRHGAHLNAQAADGSTPLIRASYYGYAFITDLLLENDSIDVNLIDKEGNTALHVAITYNRNIIVEKLLEHPKIDMSLRKNTNTYAMHAAVHHNFEALKLLLPRKDVELHAANKNGKTPLKVIHEYRAMKEAAGEDISVYDEIEKLLINRQETCPSPELPEHKKKILAKLAKKEAHYATTSAQRKAAMDSRRIAAAKRAAKHEAHVKAARAKMMKEKEVKEGPKSASKEEAKAARKLSKEEAEKIANKKEFKELKTMALNAASNEEGDSEVVAMKRIVRTSDEEEKPKEPAIPPAPKMPNKELVHPAEACHESQTRIVGMTGTFGEAEKPEPKRKIIAVRKKAAEVEAPKAEDKEESFSYTKRVVREEESAKAAEKIVAVEQKEEAPRRVMRIAAPQATVRTMNASMIDNASVVSDIAQDGSHQRIRVRDSINQIAETRGAPVTVRTVRRAASPSPASPVKVVEEVERRASTSSQVVKRIEPEIRIVRRTSEEASGEAVERQPVRVISAVRRESTEEASSPRSATSETEERVVVKATTRSASPQEETREAVVMERDSRETIGISGTAAVQDEKIVQETKHKLYPISHYHNFKKAKRANKMRTMRVHSIHHKNAPVREMRVDEREL